MLVAVSAQPIGSKVSFSEVSWQHKTVKIALTCQLEHYYR
jgi:hypothetical protein